MEQHIYVLPVWVGYIVGGFGVVLLSVIAYKLIDSITKFCEFENRNK